MGLQKGQTNNTKGRPAGSLNKLSNELRQLITEFLRENFGEVKKIWLNCKNDKDKLSFYKELLKYSVPALQSTEITGDFEKLTDEQLDYIIDELKNSQSE